MTHSLLCILMLSILMGAATVSPCCLGTPPEEGTLEGHVTIGPLCPVEPCTVTPEMQAQAYAARKVLVYTADRGRLLEEVPIDVQGNYAVSLPPGSYYVDINNIGVDSSPDVPTEVDIGSGETVMLDISIDTGIR